MMLPSEWDIATIGAGPGRLFMANLMGLSGHRVVLLERNKGLLDMLHEQTKLAPLPSRAATLRNAPMQIAVCVMFLPQAQRAAPAIENLVAEQMAPAIGSQNGLWCEEARGRSRRESARTDRARPGRRG